MPDSPKRSRPTQAAMAADQLWKFQLRKEHKAIADHIGAEKKRFDLQIAEIQQSLNAEQHRGADLAARITELEGAQLTQEQFKALLDVQEMLRENRDAFLTGRITSGEFDCQLLVKRC